uniref:Uncharacterized protein n=1 Tax=Sander lucioperca TaxID=283035 RepID=A0A8C9WY26_SANLU
KTIHSVLGLTTACLKAAGTEPKLRQELKKVRRLDPMVLLKTSFTILAGTMSKGQLVGFMLHYLSYPQTQNGA